MGKVIRLDNKTEKKIAEYKELLKESTKATSTIKMIDEANDNAIIRAAIETAIAYIKIYL